MSDINVQMFETNPNNPADIPLLAAAGDTSYFEVLSRLTLMIFDHSQAARLLEISNQHILIGFTNPVRFPGVKAVRVFAEHHYWYTFHITRPYESSSDYFENLLQVIVALTGVCPNGFITEAAFKQLRELCAIKGYKLWL